MVAAAKQAAISLPDSDQPPLMIRAPEAARLLGISLRHLKSLNSSGRLPGPIRLGKAACWRVEELRQWVEAGCPERTKWAAIQSAGPC